MSTQTDGAALLAAIIEQPADDLVRLAYADWLEESEQCNRAAAIRYALWVSRANLGWPEEPVESAHWNDDHNHWLAHGLTCGSSRGFMSLVSCPLAAWLDHGAEVCRQHPVERVDLSDKSPHVREYSGGCERYCWYRGSLDSSAQTSVGPERLPEAIWRILCPGSKPSDYFVKYDTPELAEAALSAALIRYARGTT